MSIKLLRRELLGVVLCLMGTDYINSANAQQTNQQTIVSKAEAALAACDARNAGPLQFPTEDEIWWAQLARHHRSYLARCDAQVVVMKKPY
jgi:hypothetical protein